MGTPVIRPFSEAYSFTPTIGNPQQINCRALYFDPYPTDPEFPVRGQVWYNTTEKKFKGFNGEAVVELQGFTLIEKFQEGGSDDPWLALTTFPTLERTDRFDTEGLFADTFVSLNSNYWRYSTSGVSVTGGKLRIQHLSGGRRAFSKWQFTPPATIETWVAIARGLMMEDPITHNSFVGLAAFDAVGGQTGFIRFRFDRVAVPLAHNWYAETNDGTNTTSVLVGSYLFYNWNKIKFVWNVGSVDFYINDVLVTTINTNLPPVIPLPIHYYRDYDGFSGIYTWMEVQDVTQL